MAFEERKWRSESVLEALKFFERSSSETSLKPVSDTSSSIPESTLKAPILAYSLVLGVLKINSGRLFAALRGLALAADVPESRRGAALVNQYDSLTCHTPGIVTIPVL